MRRVSTFLIVGFAVLIFFGTSSEAQAAALRSVSDTISTSIPGAPADHTIRFTTTTAVPAGGIAEIVFQTDAFKVPSLTHFDDVDVSVNGVEQTLGADPLPGVVGVSIVSGTQGSVSFTFPSGLTAGSLISIKIGEHANVGALGEVQVRNPRYQGSYRISITTKSSGGGALDTASAMISTLFPTRFAGSLGFEAEKNIVIDATGATTTTLSYPNGNTLAVTTPADFVPFSDEIQLTVGAYYEEDIAVFTQSSGKGAVGTAYELLLTRLSTDTLVESFSEDVTLDLYYSNADIEGIDESTLTAAKWNGAQWIPVSGSALYPAENRVSVSVPSFSIYMIIGDLETAPVPASSGGSTSSGGGGGGGYLTLETTASTTTPTAVRADVSGDGRVNLTDFSIMAYWYGRPLTSAGKLADLNNDGKVTLTDFSILAYYLKL